MFSSRTCRRNSTFCRSRWLVISFMACWLRMMNSMSGADESATFTDPALAGPDFVIQGEYLGTVGPKEPGDAQSNQIAAQIISLGDGKFDGVLYGGGLPGAGWDSVTRFALRGIRDGGVVRFTGVFGERLRFENPNFQGTIVDGVFRGNAEMFLNFADSSDFVMKKIHRTSPTSGAKPPPGAIVLFDGTNVDEWINARMVDDNLLDVGTDSKREFSSMFFHLEFRTPFMPQARGMHRGNSGVYVKKEWEIQIVDSFGWNSGNHKFERLANFGRCGGFHEMVKPRVNMCFPPLSWQTFDVEFTVAQFDKKNNKVTPAMISIQHNGVVIHDKFVLPPLPPGTSGPTREHLPGPLFLQDHGNPVRFRNIWVTQSE